MYVDSNVFFDRIVQAACKFDVRALNQFASTVSIDILSLVQISNCRVLISPAGYLAATGRHKEVELLRENYNASSMYVSFGVGINKDKRYLGILKNLNFLDFEFATQGLALAGMTPQDIRIYLDTSELDEQRLMIGYANGRYYDNLNSLYKGRKWQNHELEAVLIALEMSHSWEYIKNLIADKPELNGYLGYGCGILKYTVPKYKFQDSDYQSNYSKGELLSGKVSALDRMLENNSIDETTASEVVASNGNLCALKLMLIKYPDLSITTISNAGYRFRHISCFASIVSWCWALCRSRDDEVSFILGLKDSPELCRTGHRLLLNPYKLIRHNLKVPSFEHSVFWNNFDQRAQFLALRLSMPGNYSVYYSESDKQYYLPPELWERVLYFFSSSQLSPEYIKILYLEYSRLYFPVSTNKYGL